MRGCVRALVIVLIIAVLAAIIVPRVIGLSHRNNVDATKSDLMTIRALLGTFHLDCGRYPTTSEDLSALLARPPGLKDRWLGPYTSGKDGQISDPWGNPYLYKSHAGSFTLFRLGADGRAGGKGLDADLVVTD